MPIALFADSADPSASVSLPLWLTVLLAVMAPSGPIVLIAQWLYRVWRDRHTDTVEDEEARVAREEKHETTALRTLREQVKDLKARHDADRADCDDRVDRLESQVRDLTERLIRKEGRWQRLVGWVMYLQSLLATHAPELKFDRYIEEPAEPTPLMPPAEKP